MVAFSFENESTIAAKKTKLMVQQMKDMMNEYKATSIKSEYTLRPKKPDFESYETNSPNSDENWMVYGMSGTFSSLFDPSNNGDELLYYNDNENKMLSERITMFYMHQRSWV